MLTRPVLGDRHERQSACTRSRRPAHGRRRPPTPMLFGVEGPRTGHARRSSCCRPPRAAARPRHMLRIGRSPGPEADMASDLSSARACAAREGGVFFGLTGGRRKVADSCARPPDDLTRTCRNAPVPIRELTDAKRVPDDELSHATEAGALENRNGTEGSPARLADLGSPESVPRVSAAGSPPPARPSTTGPRRGFVSGGPSSRPCRPRAAGLDSAAFWRRWPNRVRAGSSRSPRPTARYRFNSLAPAAGALFDRAEPRFRRADCTCGWGRRQRGTRSPRLPSWP